MWRERLRCGMALTTGSLTKVYMMFVVTRYSPSSHPHTVYLRNTRKALMIWYFMVSPSIVPSSSPFGDLASKSAS